MDKYHPSTTPMVVQSLKIEKDPFHPWKKKDEDALRSKVPYLDVIGALMYHANNTQHDITFAMNLLERFCFDLT